MVLVHYNKIGDYMEQRRDVLNLAKSNPELEKANRKSLAICEQEMKTAKEIQRAVPGVIHIADRGPTENAIGFVEVANPIPHVVAGVMQNTKLAVHVAVHENNHKKHIHRGIRDLNLKTAFKDPALKALKEATGITNLPEVDLIEGFTELATIHEVGKEEGILYNEKEVPAAKALSDWVQAKTGKALLETFLTGNEDQVFSHITQALEAPTQNQPRF